VGLPPDRVFSAELDPEMLPRLRYGSPCLDRLDRLGWAAGIAFSSYGVRIGIRLSTAEVLAAARDCLPPNARPIATPVVDHLYSLRVGGSGAYRGLRHFHQLYAETTRLARTMQLTQVFVALADDLDSVVALEARGRLFVHAGVVGWRGRAIVIPGPSGSGKTSMVAALLRAGATYYSDEYAVLDRRGRVHPFPRPLSVRAGPDGIPRRESAADLGAKTGTASLPTGLIVVTGYQPGASWKPRHLTPGQVFLALLRNTVAVRKQPDTAFQVLRQVASAGSGLAGRRGDASLVADQVLSHAARISSPAG
jgi:hypothetical protein